MRRIFGPGLMFLLILGACGDGHSAVPTSPTTTITAPPATTTTAPPATIATTTIATTTIAATTIATTTTTTMPPTTTQGGEDLPTYAEVLATYPAGTDPCTTQAGISGGGGGYSLGGFDGQSASIQIRNGEMLTWCLGARYVVTGPMVDEDGEPISVGALLTLDADFLFVQVSSFN